MALCPALSCEELFQSSGPYSRAWGDPIFQMQKLRLSYPASLQAFPKERLNGTQLCLCVMRKHADIAVFH